MSATDSKVRPPSKTSAWKYLAIYYALACGVSCVLWSPLVLGQDGFRLLKFTPSLPFWGSLGTLGPFVAAGVTHRLETGTWRFAHLIPRKPKDVLWIVLGPLLVFVCIFLVFPALASKGDPRTWHWHIAALAAIPGYMFGHNLLGGPLFEEFGWRGFLQPRLQSILPPWIAAICVGTLWAAWHFPLFLVHGWTEANPLEFLFILAGLSLVMAFGFNASGQLIVTAILMHTAFNVSAIQLGDFLDGTALRNHPPEGWLFAASFWLAGIAFALLTRGRIAAEHASNL